MEGPPKLHLLIESNEEWRVRDRALFTHRSAEIRILGFRWNKPSGKSSGFSSRRQLLHSRPKCGILPQRLGDTASCSELFG